MLLLGFGSCKSDPAEEKNSTSEPFLSQTESSTEVSVVVSDPKQSTTNVSTTVSRTTTGAATTQEITQSAAPTRIEKPVAKKWA